ncbi:VOC family protein [Streptacidiphilus sp. PAMC 29251]
MATAAPQKITPFLMLQGRAEEAITYYTSLFNGDEVGDITRYRADARGEEGTVQRATFSLAGQRFMCIDSYVKREAGFSSGISLFVQCEAEAEIDRLYAALAEQGDEVMPLGSYGFSRKFGWVTDRFGVSWQLDLPA